MDRFYAESKGIQVIQNPNGAGWAATKAKPIRKAKSEIQSPGLDFGFGVAGLGSEAMARYQANMYGRSCKLFSP